MHSYILSLHAVQKMVKCGNPPHIGLGDPPTSIWESWPDVTDLVWPFLSSLVYALNHGLGPLFCCFITLSGAEGSLDPPGAPWCPLAPPWTPWCPPDPWYVILSHG